jgi:hypothetical protein
MVTVSGTAELGCTIVLEESLCAGRGGRGWIFRLAVLWRRTWALSVCYPVRNILVPLFLCTPLQQSYDGNGHVIATNTSSITVRSQAVVHHVLTNGRKILLRHDSTPDELDNGLGRLDIPNT